MKRNFKVWAVAGGPYSREQLEDAYYEEQYSEFPEDGNFLLLCNVEEKKSFGFLQRSKPISLRIILMEEWKL